MKKLTFILFFVCSFVQSQTILNSYAFLAACTADPNEQFTDAGVASDPNCNESSSIATFLSSGSVSEASSTDANAGTYSLESTADAGGTEFSYFVILASNGDTFDISIDFKQTVGTVGDFRIIGASPNGNYNFTSSWVTHTVSVTATGNMTFRFYPADASGSGNIGDKILIDNISIIKTN